MIENIDENSDYWWVQEFIPEKTKISKKKVYLGINSETRQISAPKLC